MWPNKKKELTLEQYNSLIVHGEGFIGEPDDCGIRRRMRWSRYFNGWTTWDSDDVNNALYPKRDETCWKYAGRML